MVGGTAWSTRTNQAASNTTAVTGRMTPMIDTQRRVGARSSDQIAFKLHRHGRPGLE